MSFEPQEIITSHDQLRSIMKQPSAYVAEKDLGRINDVARAFIAMSPFVVVATKGGDGLFDLSPKGDPAGFVEVYDDKTLLLPDRLGNFRLDTFENLLTDPGLALIFLIPGHTETLRVAGRGSIVRDPAAQQRHAVNGRQPDLLLAVQVEQVFMHCSKSLVRSRLWQQETWPERRAAPTLAQWNHAVNAQDKPVELLQSWHDEDAANRLY